MQLSQTLVRDPWATTSPADRSSLSAPSRSVTAHDERGARGGNCFYWRRHMRPMASSTSSRRSSGSSHSAPSSTSVGQRLSGRQVGPATGMFNGHQRRSWLQEQPSRHPTGRRRPDAARGRATACSAGGNQVPHELRPGRSPSDRGLAGLPWVTRVWRRRCVLRRALQAGLARRGGSGRHSLSS
jgi:hypothetical protein